MLTFQSGLVAVQGVGCLFRRQHGRVLLDKVTGLSRSLIVVFHVSTLGGNKALN